MASQEDLAAALFASLDTNSDGQLSKQVIRCWSSHCQVLSVLTRSSPRSFWDAEWTRMS